jgi:bacillithiol system protein YtxJ
MNAAVLLDTLDALEATFAASHQRPVLVFKHSLICPISTSAHRRFENFVARNAGRARFALIEIQNARPLSNEVAHRTGIRHESPQALLLRDGAAVWHASHGAITEEAMADALARVSGEV